MTPNMTAVFLKSGFHLVSILKETFHQFPAKVSSKTKMEVVSGDLSLSIHTTLKEKYLLATGMVSNNILSSQESIFSLMLRIQEYLPKELLKHIVSEFMLIHKLDTTSSSTICHNKAYLNLILNSKTESFIWLSPQSILRSVDKLKHKASYGRCKLTLQEQWTKSLWIRLWKNLKINELTLFQPTWHCLHHHLQKQLLTSVKCPFPSTSSLNNSVTSVSTPSLSRMK